MREEAYALSGILARGSRRSRELAASRNVPLFESTKELTGESDIACFAIGSSGSEIIPNLLAMGMHVLCEHPRLKADLDAAFHCASKNHVCFHVNGHFGDLPAPMTFIEKMRTFVPLAPLHLNVAVTNRSLYAAVDIIRRGLGRLAPFEFAFPTRAGLFACTSGLLAGVPTTFQIQDRSGTRLGPLADRSGDYSSDFQIIAVYPEGVLSLLSLAGPVVWNRNYNRAAGEEALWSALGRDRAFTAKELRRERVLANLAAIDQLARSIRGSPPASEQTSEHILEVAEVWELLCERLKGRDDNGRQ